MNRDLLKHLLSTADDRRLTRTERKDARARMADLSDADRLKLVDALFLATADRMLDSKDRETLGWLEDLVRIVISGGPDAPLDRAPAPWARFGPEDPMVESVLAFVDGSRKTLDIAVFTLTDDRLSEALAGLHRRGVAVRLLTDNDKSWDRGSDVKRLLEGGLNIRMDRSEHHFHHKFAVRDGAALLNGSYNWTRGADRHNRENFLVTHDPGLVRSYGDAFQAMWDALA